MASRLSRTLLSQVARPALRSSRNAGRRMMSTESHAASSKGSDMPWIIGSAVVFGPLAVYLLTPPAKAKVHHSVEKSIPESKESVPEAAPVPATPVPTKDDEGTEVPAADVEASTQAAINEDSPKDAHAAEEGKGTSPSDAAESAPAEEPAAPSDAPAEESKESTPEPEEKPKDAEESTPVKPEDARTKENPKEASKES